MKKTRFNKKLNIMIVVAIICFVSIFSFSLRYSSLLIEKEDESYFQELQDKISSTQQQYDQNNHNNQNINENTNQDIVIHKNFYTLSDAILEAENKAKSFKYSASGMINCIASALGIDYDFDLNFSYSRTRNHQGNKFFTLCTSGPEILNTFSTSYENLYYYNAKTKTYRVKQYIEPTIEYDKEFYEANYGQKELVSSLFTINSQTIESVEYFSYNEQSGLYTIEATINPTLGTQIGLDIFKMLVSSLVNGQCSTSATKLNVSMIVNKDCMITSASYDVTIGLEASVFGLTGYGEVSGVLVEKLQSYNEMISLHPSF